MAQSPMSGTQLWSSKYQRAWAAQLLSSATGKTHSLCHRLKLVRLHSCYCPWWLSNGIVVSSIQWTLHLHQWSLKSPQGFPSCPGARPQPVFLTSSVLKFCCHQKSLTIWETFTLPVSSAVLRCSLSWNHSFSVFAQRKYAKKFHLSVAGLLLITADFQSLLTGISCPIEANISLQLCWSFRNHCWFFNLSNQKPQIVNLKLNRNSYNK